MMREIRHLYIELQNALYLTNGDVAAQSTNHLEHLSISTPLNQTPSLYSLKHISHAAILVRPRVISEISQGQGRPQEVYADCYELKLYDYYCVVK